MRARASLGSLFRRFWSSPGLSIPGDPHHRFLEATFVQTTTRKKLVSNYFYQGYEDQVNLQYQTTQELFTKLEELLEFKEHGRR